MRQGVLVAWRLDVAVAASLLVAGWATAKEAAPVEDDGYGGGGDYGDAAFQVPSPAPTLPDLTRQSAHARGNEVPAHFSYKPFADRICSGQSYTVSKSTGCNGWSGLSEVQCQQKCSENAQAPNCPKKQCVAAAFFSAGGWCHLYEPSQCQTLNGEQYALTYKKVKTDVTDVFEDPVKKVKTGILDNPVVHNIEKTMQSPVAKKVLSATAVAALVGAVAAGVGAALHTRGEAWAPAEMQHSSTHAPGVKPSSEIMVGNSAFLKQAGATTVSPPSPTLPPQPLVQAALTPTTIVPGASSGASALSSSGGLPLWLPLVALCCCCMAAVLTVIAFGSKRKMSRSYSYDEDSDEEFSE